MANKNDLTDNGYPALGDSASGAERLYIYNPDLPNPDRRALIDDILKGITDTDRLDALATALLTGRIDETLLSTLDADRRDMLHHLTRNTAGVGQMEAEDLGATDAIKRGISEHIAAARLVDTVDDIASEDGTATQIVPRGWDAADDGGGGQPWYWDAESTATENRFNVRKGALPTGRYLKPRFDGPIIARKAFGLGGKGASSDPERFKDILAYFRQGTATSITDPTYGSIDVYRGGEVILPEGTTQLEPDDDDLTIGDVYGLMLSGVGSRHAANYIVPPCRLLFSGAGTNYGLRIQSNGARKGVLRDLAFEYDSSDFTGHVLDVHGGTGLCLERVSIGGAAITNPIRTAKSCIRLGRMEDFTMRKSSLNDAQRGIWVPNDTMMLNGALIEQTFFYDLVHSMIEFEAGGSSIINILCNYFDPIRIVPHVGIVLRANGFNLQGNLFTGNSADKNPPNGFCVIEGRGSETDNYWSGDKVGMVVVGGVLALNGGGRNVSRLPIKVLGGSVRGTTGELVPTTGATRAISLSPPSKKITVSAAIVAGNSITLTVNSISVGPVVFRQDSDSTMEDLAAAISLAVGGGLTCRVTPAVSGDDNNREIVVSAGDDTAPTIEDWSVTGGDSQPTATIANYTNAGSSVNIDIAQVTDSSGGTLDYAVADDGAVTTGKVTYDAGRLDGASIKTQAGGKVVFERTNNPLLNLTADYTSPITETNGEYTNFGATAAIVVTLPASAPLGTRRSLRKMVNQTFGFTTQGSDRIYNGGTSGVASLSNSSNELGVVLVVEKVSTAGHWAVVEKSGTWA